MKSNSEKKTASGKSAHISAKPTVKKADPKSKKALMDGDDDFEDLDGIPSKKGPGKKIDSKKSVTKKKPAADDEEEDIDDELNELPIRKLASKKSALKKGKVEVDDDDEDLDNLDDDFNTVEDDFDIDKEFEEFDMPKSKSPKKKSSKDDDFDVDEEFKDLGFFPEATGGFDDDDDF